MIRLIIQHLSVYDELDVKVARHRKTIDIKTLHLAALPTGPEGEVRHRALPDFPLQRRGGPPTRRNRHRDALIVDCASA
jgi:hypothetical protein